MHVSDHCVISMQHWRKLNHHKGDPHPVERSRHVAVCLDYGGQLQLFVMGGLSQSSKVLSDAWLLDLPSGQWKEVRALISVCYLCAVECHVNSIKDMSLILRYPHLVS